MATIATLDLTGITNGQELSAFNSSFSKTGSQTGSLTGNAAGRLAAGVSVVARYEHSATPGSANQTVSAVIYRSGTSSGDLRLFARLHASGTQGYYVRLSSGNLELRVHGGSAALLGSATAHNIADGGSKTVAIVCNGDNIKVTLNGADLIVPAPNSEWTGVVGNAGIGNGSLTVQNYQFVSWQAEDDTVSGGSSGAAVAYLCQL